MISNFLARHRSTPTAEVPRKFSLRSIAASLAPGVGLVVILLLFGGVSSSFLTLATWQGVMTNAAQTCLVALGLTVVLMAGGFDLAVGASSQLATAVVASLLAGGHPLLEAIVVGIAVGVLAGGASGCVTLGLKVPSFVGTLAISFILIGAAFEVTGQQQITLTERGVVRLIGQGSLVGIPVDFLIAVLVALGLALEIRSRRFGLHLRVAGLGTEGAFLQGVHVVRAKLGAFVLGGAVVGLGGVIGATYSSGASGSDNSFALLLSALAAAFIGQAISSRRQFNIWGTLAGAVFLTAIGSALISAGVSSNFFPVAEGMVILCAVGAGAVRRHAIGQDAVV